MATERKYLDQFGVGYLWSKIKDALSIKADKSNLDSLENRVEAIETAQIELYGGSASDVIKGEE